MNGIRVSYMSRVETRKVEGWSGVGGTESVRTGDTCPDEHLNVFVHDLVERGHGGTHS